MKNTIPYSLLVIFLLSKCFAWWMLYITFAATDVELIVTSLILPAYQSSYLLLSTVLLIGVLFRSRFAIIAFFLTAPVNLTIFIFSGAFVYQGIWDPVLMAIFVIVVNARTPNSWSVAFSIPKFGQVERDGVPVSL